MAVVAARLQRQGYTIGVVPTMGALHEGHLSLIRAAARENDRVIVTIFVNPLQFGPKEDFARYPRNPDRDLRLCQAHGADIVFSPSVEALYPTTFQTFVSVGPLAEGWEGKSRPGHFRGVATVVAMLFHLTRPTKAYFGQKDYQQLLVVRRMVEDLCMAVEIRRVPTIREPDGLAMSSRNQYLSALERRQATVLYQALRLARQRILDGERKASPILRQMRRLIQTQPKARLDYAAIVDARTLIPQERLHGRVAVLLAAWMGKTRLIDNIVVDVP